MPVSESRNLSAEAPMIYKGKRQQQCKKMGSAFSKQKQKKEGLMSQMKSKTELSSPTPSGTVSPSPSFCQTPPPRNLATTLSSPPLSQEFLSFLTTLDKASCLEEDECGRADSLQFVLDLRALDGKEGEIPEHNFARYFPISGGGLVLENQELWKECAGIVTNKRLTKADKVMLDKAASACCNELEPLHLIFLSQRKEPSPVCQMISCLL